MTAQTLTVPTSRRAAFAADPAARLRLVLTTNAVTSVAAGVLDFALLQLWFRSRMLR